MKDKEYMQLALELAASTKGQTSPNPSVGAIVVNNGEVVGIGSHLKAGEAHAEVHALNMAGDKAHGSTIYVTLEPCSHYGKTPPCAELIVEKGVKRVVIATKDPNPQVAGRGVVMLQAAGLQVEVGLLGEKAALINEEFNHYMQTERPFVTVKTAMTIDGKIATSTGESQWITGTEARLDTHRYRHEHDAILVGIGTVLSDDPQLTTRLPNGGNNPIRIILDSQLRTPVHAKIITDNSTETWIVVGKEIHQQLKSAYKQPHVKIIEMKNGIHIPELLQHLGELGIMSLFVEGGATVNSSFLTAKLIDQLIVYMAPKLVGGQDAATCFGGRGIEQLEDALHFTFESIEQVGDDLKLMLKPE